MPYLLRLSTNGYAQLTSTFSVAGTSSLSIKFKAAFTSGIISEIYGLGTSTAERLQYNGTGFFFRLNGTNGNTITTATIASLVSGYSVANANEYELRKILFEDGSRTRYRLFVNGVDCGILMSIFGSGGDTFQFSRIGSASTAFMNGDLYYMDCFVDGVKTRSYDPSATGGSGSTLVDTTGSQNGTLNGTFAWVFYSSGTYTLTADGATFSYSGGIASTIYNRFLSADGGSFSYSGGVATTLLNRRIAADGATFGYSGGVSALLYGRALQASGGSFSYSGGVATFVYNPITGYVLNADGGIFSYAGGEAALSFNQNYPTANPNDYTVSAYLSTDSTYTAKLSESSTINAIISASSTFNARLN